MWALGVLLYYAATGLKPNYSTAQARVNVEDVRVRAGATGDEPLLEHMLALASKLLYREPAKRANIHDALRDPCFVRSSMYNEAMTTAASSTAERLNTWRQMTALFKQQRAQLVDREPLFLRLPAKPEESFRALYQQVKPTEDNLRTRWIVTFGSTCMCYLNSLLTRFRQTSKA